MISRRLSRDAWAAIVIVLLFPRDDKFIAMAEAEVIKFLAEVDEKQKILEEIVSETV